MAGVDAMNVAEHVVEDVAKHDFDVGMGGEVIPVALPAHGSTFWLMCKCRGSPLVPASRPGPELLGCKASEITSTIQYGGAKAEVRIYVGRCGDCRARYLVVGFVPATDRGT